MCYTSRSSPSSDRRNILSHARIVGPSEGRILDVRGDRIVVETHGSETAGRFSLAAFSSPEDGGPIIRVATKPGIEPVLG